MARITTLVLLAIAALTGTAARADEAPAAMTMGQAFIAQYCLDCHDGDTTKGDVRLDLLGPVDASNAAQWKSVWVQVALKQMPPPKKKNQPDPMDRIRLSDWVVGQLQVAMKDKGGFHEHQHPAKGNYLDHDLLFGKLPDNLKPTATPARIWRLTPQEHLTRLNELINKEPQYDPKRPGLRAHGDQIPPNEDGEVKVYYGLDRLIGWVGGSAAYAAAITGFPPMLSSDNIHGLRNYPTLYSVNGAEATQIAGNAEEIIRFMAYGPKAEPYQFADKVGDIDQKYKHESLRGLSQSLFYSKEPKRPLTPVYELMREPGVSDEKLTAAVNYLYEALTFRPPTERQSQAYLQILKESIADLGKEKGVILGLVPIFLDRDALFRPELVRYGAPDSHGRVMLQGHELQLAINAAFSYIPPDAGLKQALDDGRLKTRADVEREVDRILQDDSIRKPRILQFFREYFDYDRAGPICKDMAALRAAGGDQKNYYRTMFARTASTDRLVEIILQEDKNVLYELLTTDRVVVDPKKDALYFGEFVGPQKGPKAEPADPKAQRKADPSSPLVRNADFPNGQPTDVRIAKVVVGNQSPRRLTTMPADQRMGILTDPSWLVSHSDAMDNHAILRGKWIRERLLGGAIPDVPISVNAMLPDEPGTTLRHRMRVTQEEYCWTCHRKMDPLGMPFEMYNHLGMYRKTELGKPVDSTGEIIDSGDPALDGPVDNALEMIRKIAKSERANQVFVRYAFRYWMGRNETLDDAPVLQDAYKAYTDSGGSMRALLKSLLTSDAFLYRRVEQPAGQAAR